MIARRVVDGTVVVRLRQCKRPTKLNTNFITVPTEIIVQVIFLRDVATRPEGALADPVKPNAGASSATAERPPGEVEAAGAGATAGGREPPEDPLEEPPEEPPGEQQQLKWAPKMTWSSPRQKNRTGPHASKDAVEEPPKGAWMPQMQTQGETPHEMGQAHPDCG